MLLSFDVLGNPRGFYKKIASGVNDAFYEPLNALANGPEEFAIALSRGGKSLRDNVVHGVSDSISKLSVRAIVLQPCLLSLLLTPTPTLAPQP